MVFVTKDDPRPSAGPNKRDSGLGKEGKANQRSRNKDEATTKLTKGAGSSGKAIAVSHMPHLDWSELEPDLEWLCDIAGKISHTQIGGNGYLSVTVNVPLSYSHEVVEAAIASQQGMTFFRMYRIATADYMAHAPEGSIGYGEQPPA